MTPTAIEKLAAGPEQSLSVDNPAVADITVDDFLLDGRPMDAQVAGALVDVGLNRAIDGASTITATVSDPKLELLNSPVLAKAVDLWIDDLAFRLAGIDLNDDQDGPELGLTLEARAVARLRLFDEPLAVSRAHSTRAEFMKRLCDEAGVPFVCPQLHKRQPIQKESDRLSKRAKDKRRHPGLKNSAVLTVGGTLADSGQRRNMERVLDVAHSHHSPETATLALLEACIVEPGETVTRGFTNPAGGDGTSSGMLQVLAPTAAAFGIDARDIEAVCAAFLTDGFVHGKGSGQGAISLANKHPDWTPGQVAQACQGSRYAQRYELWREEANKILDAYTGGDVGAGDAPDTYPVAYMFRRGTDDGKREDSWTCMRRLADEVNWRLWEDAGTVYLMTDDDILRSRVMHTITPSAEGIDKVRFRLDTGKPVQEVTVECHARRWQAPPGTVAELEGYGKADGRWIVATINRPSLFANATTVTLHRRQKAKLEPAHDTRQRPAGDTTGGVSLAEAKPGDVVIAQGANAAGRPLTADLLQFTRLMAGVYGAPLIITTGTNHDKYSASGLISDHYDGNAADFGMVANHGTNDGPVGDRIAAAALIVAGVDPERARILAKRRGPAGFHELYHDGLRVQVIWGSDVGGNHHNHVHVGVRRTGAPNPSTTGRVPGIGHVGEN